MNLARLRLASQRLTGEPFDTAAETVAWFGAVQAQDYPNAKWGVAQRMRGATNTQIDRAFNAGEIVRTHALRPTWHFIAASDLRWILALTGPRVQAANARVYRQFELGDALLRKAHTHIAKALAGNKSLTRAELARLLESKRIPAAGQRMTFIAMHAELSGLICSGPLRDKQHTYMLVDERAPNGLTLKGDEATAELARRYFRSHGPATAHDFAWWSGCTVATARRAIEMLGNELEEMSKEGKTYHFMGSARAVRPASVVHLLPNYDEHVVAYRDHAPSLDPDAPRALDGWGNARTPHLVTRNGLVAGGWRRTLEKDVITLHLTLPVTLTARQHSLLRRAAAAYGAFLDLPVRTVS